MDTPAAERAAGPQQLDVAASAPWAAPLGPPAPPAGPVQHRIRSLWNRLSRSHRVLLASCGLQVLGGLLPLASIATTGDPTISFPRLWMGAVAVAALGGVGWVLADIGVRGVRAVHPLVLGGWTLAWLVILAVAADRVTGDAYDSYPGFGLNGLVFLPGVYLLLGGSLISFGSARALIVRERRRVRNVDAAPSTIADAGDVRAAPWPTRAELGTAFRQHRRLVAVVGAIAFVGVVVHVAVGRIGNDGYTADFDPPPVGLAWPQHVRDDLYSSCMEVTETWSEERTYPKSCACFLSWFEGAFVADSGSSLASDIRALGYFPQNDNVNALVDHCFPSAEAVASVELEAARDLAASVGDAGSVEIAGWLNENWFGSPQTGMPAGAELTSNGVLCLDTSPRMGGDTMVSCYLPPAVDTIEPICTAAGELATAFAGGGGVDSWGAASDSLHETVVEADITAEVSVFVLAGEFTGDGAGEFLVQSVSNEVLFETEADDLRSWAHNGLHINGEHVLGQLQTHFVAACGVEIVLPAELASPLDG